MEPSQPDTSSSFSKIQNYAIVTLVAILIWLYSESENVKLQKPLRFSVQFVAPPGQQLLILPLDKLQAIAPTSKQQVDVTVQSATSQYAQLQQLQRTPIHLTVTEDPDHPTQIVDLRDMLLDSPLGNLGATFQAVEPRRVRLRVERIEPVTMPVRVVVADGIQLASNPTTELTESVVHLPASIAQRRTDLTLEARVEREAANRLDPNVPHAMVVHLGLSPADALPEDLRQLLGQTTIEITPPTTTVTITIRKQTDSLVLTSLPILLTGPWSDLQRFSIEIEGGQRILTDEVHISGPSDTIESIEQGQLKIWAELRLTADDLESRITSKQLHINVPQNVHVESTIPLLQFKITPLVPGPAPATGS